MISTHSRSSHLRSARQGFSLIEVAIALVIFVIGALAIIRIFPGALSVIGNNGDQQLATNLNRSVITDLESQKVTATSGVAAKVTFNAVPGATFNNSNADGTLSIASWMGVTPTANHSADFRDVNSSVIGVPRFNKTLPRTDEIETGSSESALSRYRAIIGEKALITPLTIGASTDQYALTQFPVSVQGTLPALIPVQVVVSQDVVLDDVRVQPDGTLNFSQARVDGSNNIATTIAVNNSSMLYVSYRYLNSSNVAWGIREEAVPIPATVTDLRLTDLVPTTITIKVKPPTAGRRDSARVTSGVVVDAVVPEIVQVSLRRYVGQGDFVGPTAIGQVADARRGLVRLPTGLSPIVLDNTKPVVLDYIADWSFLMQDGVPLITPNATYPALPASPPDLTYRQLALGAPFIEDQVPVSVYSLLIESGTAYKSGYGTDVPDPVAAERLVRATDPQQREDEVRSGKVTFIVENSASRARAAYQTRDNWVQQLSVAARSYKPFVGGGVTGATATVTEPWRDYYLGNDNYLYFHAGEAGKTISISYTVLDGTVPRNFVDRPFVIESTLINAGSLVPAGFIQNFAGPVGDSPQIARVQLTSSAGDVLAPSDLVSIQGIKGTSVTVRTAYINGSKYVQTLLTSNRGAK